MKAWKDRLTAPRWLLLAWATLLAAGLLAAFVDTLLLNQRQGEQRRLDQRASTLRQTISTAAGAAPARRQPPLR